MYWHKQKSGEPLFPDLLWSRPENKNQAGKLLVIGGNQYGFAAPAEAYQVATKVGAGHVRVLLPQAVKQAAGKLLPELEYGASTPSGGFAQSSLGEWLSLASWADGVLIAGDLGHNSETAMVLESFLEKYSGQLTLTKDAVDYCLATPEIVLKRPNTLLVLTMAELQKLATNAHFETAFQLRMDLLHLVEALHDFTHKHQAHIIVKHHDQIVVAVNGQVSSTQVGDEQDMWRVKTAASVAVWWLQNPEKPFEALTTSLVEQA